MSVRLRLFSLTPLPHLKCWYIIPSTPRPNLISELKTRFCEDLGPLCSDGITGVELSLFIDDFELLDDSAIDVLRDGDTICLKLRQAFSATNGKRQADTHDLRQSSKRKRVAVAQQKTVKKSTKATLHKTVSDSSSSSSESDTSTSSSSDSDSTSSSDDSDSDSSSRIPISSKANAAPQSEKSKLLQSTQPLVPPGHGKQSTKKRNQRRKLRRQSDRLRPTNGENESTTAIMPPFKPDPKSTNFVPLGEVPSASADTAVPPVMMASLRNKNKRRGFRQLLNEPRVARIVFDDDDGGNQKATESIAISGEFQEPALVPSLVHAPSIRIIPPSERQERGEIPSNMFVTSIDVEEGMWNSGGKRNRKGSKKWKEELIETSLDADVEEVDDIVLDYGGEMDGSIAQAQASASFDFAAAEQKWDSFVEVKDASQLLPGTLVGWKALAINPLTFTPEVLLNIARVAVASQQEVTVRRLLRIGEKEISFKPKTEADDDYPSVEEIEDEDENEVHLISDITSSGWRLVQL